MKYLRLTTINRITKMKMTGICINYDAFWKDVTRTADCEFDKDEYSPTERYQDRLIKIMEDVWKEKKSLPVIFSVRLEKYISLVDYPVRYTFAVIDKNFFKRTYRKEEIPEDVLKEVLAKDTDCIVFYVGMNR